MQVVEMAGARAVWKKSSGIILVTPRSSGSLFRSALTAEIQIRHFPQIELVPFGDLKPWLDLAQWQRGGARQWQ
jgi:hypothetical protein